MKILSSIYIVIILCQLLVSCKISDEVVLGCFNFIKKGKHDQDYHVRGLVHKQPPAPFIKGEKEVQSSHPTGDHPKGGKFIPTVPSGQSSIHNRVSKAQYLKRVNQIQNPILEGDIYELNYCQEFYTENVVIDPLSEQKH